MLYKDVFAEYLTHNMPADTAEAFISGAMLLKGGQIVVL